MPRELDPAVSDDLHIGRSWAIGAASPALALPFSLIGLLACLSVSASAQAVDSTGADLSTLDIQELARIKVTSVARRPETIAQASAAVAVVSREDIQRLGAANLPEALRLLPGLAAVRVSTRDWAISSRGFNAQSSNKMLVLEDGPAGSRCGDRLPMARVNPGPGWWVWSRM